MVKNRIARACLAPASGVYGAGVSLRNAAYTLGMLPELSAGLPVICIGNATVGGSGKTPMCDFLAAELIERGRRPAILMRGYGGAVTRPHVVVASDSPASVGEEAVLHYNTHRGIVPVVVSRDRHAGAELIEQSFHSDTIILDDGFQHRKLKRDVNLLLLDISSEESTAKWRGGKMLPAGYLREPLAQALKRATAVLFVRKIASGMQEVTQLAPHKYLPADLPTYLFELRPTHFSDVFSNATHPLTYFAGKEVTALSAIAAPKTFHTMLRALQATIKEAPTYRDHHRFTMKNWKHALSAGVPIVTTAKDAVKLRKFVTAPDQLLSLELRGSISSVQAAVPFWEFIEPKLAPTLTKRKPTKAEGSE